MERIDKVVNATHPTNVEQGKKQVIVASIALGAVAGAIAGSIASQFSENTVNNVINKSQSVIAHTVEEELIDIYDNQDDIKRLNRTMAALNDDFAERFAYVKRNQFETAILRVSFATCSTPLISQRRPRLS